MAKIEDFLKVGELGPLCLGLDSSTVMRECGQPDHISRKTNPLILQYGRIQLTFLRGASSDTPTLQDVLINTEPETEARRLPKALCLEDFSLLDRPTKSLFLQFARAVGCLPVTVAENQIHFASGVTAALEGDLLTSLRLSKKEATARPAMPVIDEREPTLPQIAAMLDESERADNSSAPGAALLIAWAAMEAVLRKAAQTKGLKSNAGGIPQILIRELYANQFFSAGEMRFLEETRQIRAAIAHGFSPSRPSPVVLSNLIQMVRTIIKRIS
jgi:hypothetical protein